MRLRIKHDARRIASTTIVFATISDRDVCRGAPWVPDCMSTRIDTITS
jgi:hypothetical protein